MKKSKQRQVLPFANQTAQHMTRAFHATRRDLEELQRRTKEETWHEAEEFTNCTNAITFMLALRKLHHFGQERIMKVMKQANEYTRQVNDGEISIDSLIEELAEKPLQIMIEEEYKELIKRIWS